MAPWAKADPDKLTRALGIDDFRDQIFALLDLAPRASAADLAKLPWTEPHERREFRSIRDQWSTAKHAKREESDRTDERPIADVAWDQIKAAVRTGDFKTAEAAVNTLQKLKQAEQTRPEKTDDDFARLTDAETMVLAALVHKLRDEPLTELDAAALEYVAEISLDVRPE